MSKIVEREVALSVQMDNPSVARFYTGKFVRRTKIQLAWFVYSEKRSLFRQKGVIFPSFSLVTMNFFLTNRTNFVQIP